MPSKTLELEKQKSTKLMIINLQISKNDLNHKINKFKDFLSHFSTLKIAIPVDIAQPNEMLRATNLLKNISKDLVDIGSVNIEPTRTIAKELIKEKEYNQNNEDEKSYSSALEKELKDIPVEQEIDDSAQKSEEYDEATEKVDKNNKKNIQNSKREI